MGDRRVGEHAFDVGLVHRGDGAHRHGQDRNRPQHRAPLIVQRRQRHVDNPKQRTESRHLGGGRHEPGDRGGRALVDVGNPRVEGNGADLEQQADRQQCHADQRHRGIAVRGKRIADTGQQQRAGRAVQQRHAVEEERRRKRAQQEVLHRRFLRQQAAMTGQPAHQVQRQRQDFQRNEHRQQVVGRGEHHHAADGQQGQAGRAPSGRLRPARPRVRRRCRAPRMPVG